MFQNYRITIYRIKSESARKMGLDQEPYRARKISKSLVALRAGSYYSDFGSPKINLTSPNKKRP